MISELLRIWEKVLPITFYSVMMKEVNPDIMFVLDISNEAGSLSLILKN